MIPERTLRKWRKTALLQVDEAEDLKAMYASSSPGLAKSFIHAQERILRMTQELLDLHLKK